MNERLCDEVLRKTRKHLSFRGVKSTLAASRGNSIRAFLLLELLFKFGEFLHSNLLFLVKHLLDAFHLCMRISSVS